MEYWIVAAGSAGANALGFGTAYAFKRTRAQALRWILKHGRLGFEIWEIPT